MTEEPTTAALTSLWPTGTYSRKRQLTDRGYHPATSTDPVLMPPAIAAHAIATLTHPADLVFDPDCGAATTLVEALRAGRHAIGLTAAQHWRDLARTNITTAPAAPGHGTVLLDRFPDALTGTAGLIGRITLLLTTLRPTRPSNLTNSVDRLRQLLVRFRPLLRPTGYVVITTPPWRHPARLELLDPPGQILTAGIEAGLTPIARCLALTAELRGRRVLTHATRAARRTATHVTLVTGRPSTLPAHHTVLVFRVDPHATEVELAQPIPPPITPLHVAA